MSKELKPSDKQIQVAEELMKKHKRTEIYINVVSGHMNFRKSGALLGAKKPEEVVCYPSKKSEDSKKSTPPTEDNTGSGDSGKKSEVQIPEGDPADTWTSEQLIAWSKDKLPDLKLMGNWKPATILNKIQEALKTKTPE